MGWRLLAAVGLAALGVLAAWQLLVIGYLPGMVLAGGVSGMATGAVAGKKWAAALGACAGVLAVVLFLIAWLAYDLPPQVEWMNL